VVKQNDVAEEVLQDAFLKIWDKIQAYNPEKGRLFTWMLNVTRNLAIDRNRSKEINKESKTDSLENFVGNSETSETLEQSTDTIGLPESLIQLPAEQRFVVEHLYLKGFTQSELADEFDIPLGSIITRLRLAMVQLRSNYDVK
jgi:RNA polymerase sigma-70 factor (ECF subfamily)